MSGHSHWATIKRKKGAGDAKRGQLFTKLAKEITLAARDGGDPDTNFRLRLAIDKARSNNMPKDSIDRAIKRGTGESKDGAVFEEIMYEGYGPKGVALMIECVTENRNRTVADVRHLFSKHGGSLGTDGSVSWMFDRKGVITIDRQAYDEDKMMEIALEAGADDVIDDGDVWTIQTSMEDFNGVRDNLENAGVAMQSASLAMIPQNLTAVDVELGQKVMRLMDALDDNDDVQNVYANADFPEDMPEA